MKNNKFSFLTLAFSCLVFCLCPHIQCADIYYIDKYAFKNSDERGVRLMQVDVEGKKLKKILYWNTDSDKVGTTYNFRGIEISRSGHVTVDTDYYTNKEIYKKNAFVSVKGLKFKGDREDEWRKVKENKEHKLCKTYNNRFYYTYKNANKRTFKNIEDIFSDCDESGELKILYCDEGKDNHKEKNSYDFIPDVYDRRIEKGYIGERIAYLTMWWYRYDSGYSKYEGDHGFDGIFIGNRKKEENPLIVIIESKYHESGIATLSIINKCYDIGRISKVTSIMRENSNKTKTTEQKALGETYDHIKQLLLEKNCNVLFCGHTVYQTGYYQIAAADHDHDRISSMSTEMIAEEVDYVSGKINKILKKECSSEKSKILALSKCINNVASSMSS